MKFLLCTYHFFLYLYGGIKKGFFEMKRNIIGRENEKIALQEVYNSNVSEYVAVYGRRGVGKTFLIQEFFDNKMVFEVTGLSNGNTAEQLANFNRSLNKNNTGEPFSVSNNWMEAFEQLITFVRRTSQKRKVIFFDEIHWLDTLHSGFVQALEHFSNGWACRRKNIVLIMCGSTNSRMINMLINSEVGLCNRLVKKMYLQQFTLRECELYFQSRKMNLGRYEIAECYMVMGGIPLYLNQLEKKLSVAQNFDRMFFAENATLKNELKNMYAQLFNNDADYLRLMEALSNQMGGFSRNEIVTVTKISSGGALTEILQNLENCCLIRSYPPFDKRKRNTFYQLIDPFTLFFYKFINNIDYRDDDFWSKGVEMSIRNLWVGHAFEILALLHVNEIKEALNITGIESRISLWQSEHTLPEEQVNLVINRNDGIVNLIEIKYSNMKYVITKAYEEKLKNKIVDFKAQTKTKKTVQFLMLTTYGIIKNKYSEVVHKELMMSNLFK